MKHLPLPTCGLLKPVGHALCVGGCTVVGDALDRGMCFTTIDLLRRGVAAGQASSAVVHFNHCAILFFDLVADVNVGLTGVTDGQGRTADLVDFVPSRT